VIGLALPTAFASAACYALAAALQHSGVGRASATRASGLSAVWQLCRQPRWLIGIAAMAGGAALHTAALSVGPLPLVQPIGVVSLVFALPIEARLCGRRVRPLDWWAAVSVAVGLALFLRTVRHHGPPPHLSGTATLALVVLTAGTVAACVMWAVKGHGRQRSVAFAIGAGIAFGASSALMRAVGAHVVASGYTALVGWPTLALAGVAPIGFVLCQYAYRDGNLGAPLSTMTVVDPLTAIGFGALLLGEVLRTGVVVGVTALSAGALMVAGIWVLANQPAEPRYEIADGRVNEPRSAAGMSAP
jgi:drug/metabolite transporter (DMT)-like permease